MTLRDIPEVIEIERLSFSMTWPANSYKRELSRTGWPATSSLATSRGPASPPAGPPEGVPAPLSALLLPQTAERSSPDVSPAAVVGYGGLWLMVDEAHVTSVAVHPQFRGQGLGELLMLSFRWRSRCASTPAS